MVTNRTLLASKQLLVMDEVDGMSGASARLRNRARRDMITRGSMLFAAGDRGGVSDLIQTIKSSKIPVICICNDKWNQKLRSLRGHCLELDFRAPVPAAVKKRMQEICQKEGLHLADASLETLVKGANSDLRLIIGQLQMVRLTGTLGYDVTGVSKDADRSPFDCARRYA